MSSIFNGPLLHVEDFWSGSFYPTQKVVILVRDRHFEFEFELRRLVQEDGFASDSVRMINSVRKEAPSVQVLLFSATFHEKVKLFAIRFAGADANQVPQETLSVSNHAIAYLASLT